MNHMIYNKKSGVLLVGLLAGLIACGDDPAATPPPTTPDMADMEQHPDSGGEDSALDLAPDMCVAQPMCPAGSCGKLDDGCGGELDCGACQCDAGVPVKLECGQCDLGALNCALAQPSCEQPSWPAFVTLECKNAVYVRAGAPANGAGTKEEPVGDLRVALAKAFQLGKGSLVVIGGNDTFEFTQTLELDEEIHIIGGIDPTTWTRSPNRPELRFTLSGANAVGLRARSVRNTTLISGLRIRVEANPTPGGNVYGIAANASGGLVLDRLAVEVGAGGKGADGVDGTPGTNGGDGAAALAGEYCGNFCTPVRFPVNYGGQNRACEPVGCIKTVMENGVAVACELGGRGGLGGGWMTAGQTSPAEDGKPSFSGELGGDGGEPIIGSRGGDAGRSGSQFADRAASGTPGRSSYQVVDGLFQYLGAGRPGDTGSIGKSGGGGGGASACDTNMSLPPGDRCSVRASGPSGGSGGAGGCGGTGGEGGQYGGSSFGLFVTSSQGISVKDSTFEAAQGGAGGEGALGASGGQGGFGGKGIGRVISSGQFVSTPYTSGDGGDGSKGQDGGHGGGGAGGHSAGAWCDQTQLNVTGEVNFITGGAGVGGEGARADLKGANGEANNQLNCMP